ncbi:glycoside hydrolase family 2 TIM barrel-domain containing protein [uncultured Sunxiuqinia sp.]|uniref:beta-glucuronidase LacZ4 n=1 Tax=uncultured Sunxiuqinia sp. TaxID=1573825 RepID=UPI002625CF1C|nr:glycoside hydrolase family 2 TIM barrel-domain containing protein [uncultured Sunxiuqinia sp.]
MKKSFLLLLLIVGFIAIASGQREQMVINDKWRFTYGYEVRKNVFTEINLPHTWNTKDALGGNVDYYRGLGNYERTLKVEKSWKGKRLFVRFLGVNTVANVFINGKHVGEHRGGYTAFAFEITDLVNYGEDNTLWIRVNNAPQLDIMPLVGDFNMYGGIYRDVELYITDTDLISLLDYGSKGVYLHQQEVSSSKARVNAVVKTLGYSESVVRLFVEDHSGKIILNKSVSVSPGKNQTGEVVIPFEMQAPRLWNGRKDPYLYTVRTQLIKQGNVVDEVVQPLGLRFFHVDPDKGFFLNGEHLQLKGVCRHQDRPELGNAVSYLHHAEDIAIMEEIGANAVRLSHYPQDPQVYRLLDEKGFVVWSEIPFVGPGGYRDKGFVNQASFKENGKQQLLEMIRQQINHPSIVMWGLFNELKEQGDNPVEYIKELHALSHSEDSSRITVAASNQGGALNTITDIIAWNKYYGWYGGNPSSIGTWADNQHKQMPSTPIGVSEYGAGASLYHQQEELIQPAPNSFWHPENWQTHFHEGHWVAIDQRPFLWGTFIWNLFDFGGAHRTEGEVPGKNDKGLVTFDRKDRKDAFFFYKANWNQTEPMVYVAERRIANRTKAAQTIKVYSNQKRVELWINGKKVGKATGDYARFYFEVTLEPGMNEIIAKAGKELIDKIYINLQINN